MLRTRVLINEQTLELIEVISDLRTIRIQTFKP